MYLKVYLICSEMVQTIQQQYQQPLFLQGHGHITPQTKYMNVPVHRSTYGVRFTIFLILLIRYNHFDYIPISGIVSSSNKLKIFIFLNSSALNKSNTFCWKYCINRLLFESFFVCSLISGHEVHHHLPLFLCTELTQRPISTTSQHTVLM